MVDFKAILEELDAEDRVNLSPADYADKQALIAQRAERAKNTVYFDGIERYDYSDGSNSYERPRQVGFVLEANSPENPKLTLRCVDGITGYEAWYAEDLLDAICGRWGLNMDRFYVNAGTAGRYAALSVDIAQLRDWLRQALAKA